MDTTTEMSVRRQCGLLSIHRSGLYFHPKGESELNLGLMRLMDEHYPKHPTSGVIPMQDHLGDMGHWVNHKRVRNSFFQVVIWFGCISKRLASSAMVSRSFKASMTTLALYSELNFLLDPFIPIGVLSL